MYFMTLAHVCDRQTSHIKAKGGFLTAKVGRV